MWLLIRTMLQLMVNEPSNSETSGSNDPRPALDIARPLRIVLAAAFLVVVLLTIAQVFFRFALDAPLIWSEELARILIVWIAFLGAAVVSWDGRHINVDVAFKAMSGRTRRIVRTVNALAACLLLAALISPTLRLVRIENMAETGALELPSGIIRLPVAIGAVLTIAAILLRLAVRRRRPPRRDEIFDHDPM